MSVTLTQHAIDKAVALNKNNQSLRLYLAGKGCDGFYYGVCFDDRSAEDLCFPQPSTATPDINVIVDPDTLEFTKGSTITWETTKEGAGFLVQNPNHRKYRGKFFKKSTWQQRLQS
ncbi:MAG: iron-sulfur cluster assembly accessory protein [Pseudomonadota bacterium]|nr:iron-sulfur cluster assembly accessory protein [Pseudomonadota bacterium]